MATLSKVTRLTRRILKWGAILFSSFLVLLILVRIGANIRNKFFPPPPPPPTVAFGKLPPLKFPKSKITQELSYSVETLMGTLPQVSPQAKVYKFQQNQPSLLSLEKAREKVVKLGFTRNETQISQTLYQWQDFKGRTITFNIVTNDFEMISNFYNNSEVLAAENLPDQNKAQELARNFLSELNLLPQDLESTKVSLLTIQNGGPLVSATSLSNTQILRVNFFLKGVDKLPFVYPQKDFSLINILVSGGEREPQIVEALFFYRTADLTSASTYPLKTPTEAFEELKNNKAYIAAGPEIKTDIAIKDVYLGYYLSWESPNFLQPVFVFEGNNNFVAYVPAISPSWIEEPSQ